MQQDPQVPTKREWGILDWLLAGVTVYAGYRLLQAAFDEEYHGRFFPEDVREDMIAEADRRCAKCGRRFPKRLLQADHIIPHAAGGLTSKANGQVLCKSCNSAKGSEYGVSEWFRGRKG